MPIYLREKFDRTIDKEVKNTIKIKNMIVSTRLIGRSTLIRHRLRKVRRRSHVDTMGR